MRSNCPPFSRLRRVLDFLSSQVSSWFFFLSTALQSSSKVDKNLFQSKIIQFQRCKGGATSAVLPEIYQIISACRIQCRNNGLLVNRGATRSCDKAYMPFLNAKLRSSNVVKGAVSTVLPKLRSLSSVETRAFSSLSLVAVIPFNHAKKFTSAFLSTKLTNHHSSMVCGRSLCGILRTEDGGIPFLWVFSRLYGLSVLDKVAIIVSLPLGSWDLGVDMLFAVLPKVVSAVRDQTDTWLFERVPNLDLNNPVPFVCLKTVDVTVWEKRTSRIRSSEMFNTPLHCFRKPMEELEN